MLSKVLTHPHPEKYNFKFLILQLIEGIVFKTSESSMEKDLDQMQQNCWLRYFILTLKMNPLHYRMKRKRKTFFKRPRPFIVTPTWKVFKLHLCLLKSLICRDSCNILFRNDSSWFFKSTETYFNMRFKKNYNSIIK